MAELRVRVNEQTYALVCDDGAEARVEALARYLDDHVQRLVGEVGRVAESRLLMLAALNICDELFTAREQVAAVGRADVPPASPEEDAEWAKAAEIAERIAADLEKRARA